MYKRYLFKKGFLWLNLIFFWWVDDPILSTYFCCDVIGSYYASDGCGCWVFLPELQKQSTSLLRWELSKQHVVHKLVTFKMNSTKHTFTDIGHPNWKYDQLVLGKEAICIWRYLNLKIPAYLGAIWSLPPGFDQHILAKIPFRKRLVVGLRLVSPIFWVRKQMAFGSRFFFEILPVSLCFQSKTTSKWFHILASLVYPQMPWGNVLIWLIVFVVGMGWNQNSKNENFCCQGTTWYSDSGEWSLLHFDLSLDSDMSFTPGGCQRNTVPVPPFVVVRGTCGATTVVYQSTSICICCLAICIYVHQRIYIGLCVFKCCRCMRFLCFFSCWGGNVSKTVIIDEKERWSQTRLDLSEIIVVNSLHHTTMGRTGFCSSYKEIV